MSNYCLEKKQWNLLMKKNFSISSHIVIEHEMYPNNIDWPPVYQSVYVFVVEFYAVTQLELQINIYTCIIYIILFK